MKNILHQDSKRSTTKGMRARKVVTPYRTRRKVKPKPVQFFLMSLGVERRLKRIGVFPAGVWIVVQKNIYDMLYKEDGWKGKVE